MNRFSLLLTSALVVAVSTYKMTPEIENCIAQVENRVGGETDARMKAAITQVMDGVKSDNLLAAQKVFKENTVADKNVTLDKYMVDSCGRIKTCFICPLELA